MGTEVSPAVWFPTLRAGTGADVFTQRLCDGLNARGIRAEITWLPHRAEYLPDTVMTPQAPAWANVVHVNSWLPRKFWPRELPTVVTLHHLVHDPAYHPYRSILQAAYHKALIRRRELRSIRDSDAVTVVSEYVKRTVIDFSGRQDVDVIRNWIDADRFVPGGDLEPRCDGSIRVFMAGSHSRRKGFDLLPAFVKAFGSGLEVRYAGGKMKSMSPIPNVIELGRISEAELIREYQECDAVVSLSRYEGFGYTALEAMACGKPFFGFRTSALPEVVAEHGGTLVPIGDVDALASAVRGFRERQAQRTDSPENRRNLILEQFGDSNVDQYVEIYSRLIGKTLRDRGSVS